MSYKINIIESTDKGDFPDLVKKKRASEWAKDFIYEKTTKVNQIPMFYRESLRFIISKLGTLSYINSESKLIDIKCIHANPERTIAKLTQENNIILPILSIDQNSSSNADTRRRASFSLVTESFWSEKKKRAFRVVSIAPRALDIEYKINVWSKYKANLDQIVEQIRLLFNPHLVIKSLLKNYYKLFFNK